MTLTSADPYLSTRVKWCALRGSANDDLSVARDYSRKLYDTTTRNVAGHCARQTVAASAKCGWCSQQSCLKLNSYALVRVAQASKRETNNGQWLKNLNEACDAVLRAAATCCPHAVGHMYHRAGAFHEFIIKQCLPQITPALFAGSNTDCCIMACACRFEMSLRCNLLAFHYDRYTTFASRNGI